MLTSEVKKTSIEYFSSMLGGWSQNSQKLTALCKVRRLPNIESKYVSLLSLHFWCLAQLAFPVLFHGEFATKPSLILEAFYLLAFTP